MEDTVIGERVAHMEEAIRDLKHTLFGNGQPGELKEIRTDVSSLKRDRWILMGAFGAFQFLSGSGSFSLEQLLKHFLGH